MKKSFVVIASMCMLAVLGATSALCYRSGQDGGEGEFAIYVAPGTIATGAACNWVTIHTDVAFLSVESAEDVSARINFEDEVDVPYIFPDDRGNLVAKVRFADVVAVVAPPSAVVELTVKKKSGDVVSARETVAVKD